MFAEKGGGEYFYIRGKTQQEVWQEYYRVQEFLNSKTSSITGTKQVLNNMIEYTGVEITSPQEMLEVAPDYFRLANKIEEYLTIRGLGAVYDSNQIYNQINMVVQDSELDFNDMTVDSMLDMVTDYIEKDYFNQDFNDLTLDFKQLD